jgi:hypothetical protein
MHAILVDKAMLERDPAFEKKNNFSEVNIEQFCLNMKTARYNRVEMKRLIQ